MSRPHLTEEMLDFLRTAFGSTNISGTANALLIIGAFAVGVQPPSDEIPRLLRRSDIPPELAAYVRAIGETPNVPTSPLLSPQVMSIMTSLLAAVQALTSTPWRVPPMQTASGEAVMMAGQDGGAEERAEMNAHDQNEQDEALAPIPVVEAAAPAAPVLPKERRRAIPQRRRPDTLVTTEDADHTSVLSGEPEPEGESVTPAAIVADMEGIVFDAVPEEDAAALVSEPTAAPAAPAKKRTLGRSYTG